MTLAELDKKIVEEIMSQLPRIWLTERLPLEIPALFINVVKYVDADSADFDVINEPMIILLPKPITEQWSMLAAKLEKFLATIHDGYKDEEDSYGQDQVVGTASELKSLGWINIILSETLSMRIYPVRTVVPLA